MTMDVLTCAKSNGKFSALALKGADALRYDDLKQTSVFTGKVVVTKGTILIRGIQPSGQCRKTPEFCIARS